MRGGKLALVVLFVALWSVPRASACVPELVSVFHPPANAIDVPLDVSPLIISRANLVVVTDESGVDVPLSTSSFDGGIEVLFDAALQPETRYILRAIEDWGGLSGAEWTIPFTTGSAFAGEMPIAPDAPVVSAVVARDVTDYLLGCGRDKTWICASADVPQGSILAVRAEIGGRSELAYVPHGFNLLTADGWAGAYLEAAQTSWLRGDWHVGTCLSLGVRDQAGRVAAWTEVCPDDIEVSEVEELTRVFCDSGRMTVRTPDPPEPRPLPPEPQSGPGVVEPEPGADVFVDASSDGQGLDREDWEEPPIDPAGPGRSGLAPDGAPADDGGTSDDGGATRSSGGANLNGGFERAAGLASEPDAGTTASLRGSSPRADASVADDGSTRARDDEDTVTRGLDDAPPSDGCAACTIGPQRPASSHAAWLACLLGLALRRRRGDGARFGVQRYWVAAAAGALVGARRSWKRTSCDGQQSRQPSSSPTGSDVVDR